MILDSEQIAELLKSENSHFHQIAFKGIIDNFECCADIFFDLIVKGTACSTLLQNAAQRFPSLNEGFEKPNPFLPAKKYAYFAGYAGEYTLFLNKLQAYCTKETDKEKVKGLINRLSTSFKGLNVDLCRLYPQYYVLKKEKNSINRQLMVFITGKCNLNCPYCFSMESQFNEISLTDFNEILQWAKCNQITKISLCGGEPTLYDSFDKMLLLIERQGFKTYFASNLTIDCSQFKHFNAGVIDKIFVHLTNQTLENSSLRKHLEKNIEYAKKAKIEMTCRTNITNENPPVKAWFQFLQETNIRALNIALTFPTPNASNEFVDIHSFKQYYHVIEQIINKAKEQDTNISFAKPIPLCIFDEEMSRYLLTSKNFQPLCNVNEQNCTRNLCITPHREFYACLGVSTSSLKFRKNMEWPEIERFCTRIIRPLLSKPLWEKCNDCFLFDRKLCQGACLSYKSIE